MNQLCKVCGEPAAGFHFGAFTCEGCKSFFGRTYNNISAIAGCKNNGDCVINKKNRTACKACRLRKCLLVGMSKSGSRYGRRSNWFKIHCLLQEQQSSANNLTGIGSGGSGGSGGTGTTSSGGNNNTCSLEQLARLQQASSQARQTYQDKTNPCIKSAASALSPTLALQAAAAAAAASAAAAAAAGSGSTTSTTHGLSSASSNAALNLPHFLQAAKFLNGQHNHHHHHHHQPHHQQSHNPLYKNDSRLSNTPSDSGASSAGDPTDDCTSLTNAKCTTTTTTSSTTTSASSARQRNCNSVQPPLESLHDSNERRRKELLEIFRSHSEPLRSAFAPFALPPSLLACTPPTPTTHMQQQQQQQPQPATALDEYKASTQDEPIDLSLKSISRTSRTPTPCTSPASVDGHVGAVDERTTPTNRCCSADTSPNAAATAAAVAAAAAAAAAFVRKSTPLDLTLVRSTQTLTG